MEIEIIKIDGYYNLRGGYGYKLVKITKKEAIEIILKVIDLSNEFIKRDFLTVKCKYLDMNLTCEELKENIDEYLNNTECFAAFFDYNKVEIFFDNNKYYEICRKETYSKYYEILDNDIKTLEYAMKKAEKYTAEKREIRIYEINQENEDDQKIVAIANKKTCWKIERYENPNK